MPFENLPGIPATKQDGNLTLPATNDAPIVVVLGTAAQGDTAELYSVARPADAARVFGKEGTLIRGMYEAAATGASNLRLFRIGATAAKLADLGGGLITVETVERDGDAGSNYSIWYDSSSGRLRVYRESDDLLVFDSGDGTAGSEVDLGEVVVTGSGAGGLDVGSSGSPVTLATVSGVDAGVTFTAGDDGLNLNRMQTYEALDEAYTLLEDADLDFVTPMNVFLDDLNVTDMTSVAVSGLMVGIDAHDDILPNSATDVLGKLYTEEFQGKKYYFWDIDLDGVAEIVPTVDGLTSGQQTTLDGGEHSIAAVVAGSSSDLTAADFHEVNFAYQLANFLYNQSHLNTEMSGTIGVKPPNSYSAKDVSQWIGQAPTTVTDSDGNTLITVNGTGLLGNKWMAGRLTDSSSGTLPGHIIDGVDGAPNGGFIATDDGWIDGTQLSDDNDALIDLGKYIDVVSQIVRVANPAVTSAYTTSGAASYVGLLSTLRGASAATNKIVRSVQLPFRVSKSKIDLLAGKRFVHFLQKPQGVVVADAPTAARPESDYNRRSTMQIVKAAIDVVRRTGEPFLGEGISSTQLAALDTVIRNALAELVKAGVLVRFDLSVTATALQRVNGQATVQLVLVPAFELREIAVTLSLAAN